MDEYLLKFEVLFSNKEMAVDDNYTLLYLMIAIDSNAA
jgi:hypothetical protein